MRPFWLSAVLTLALAVAPAAQEPIPKPTPAPAPSVVLTGPPGLYQVQAPAAVRLYHGPDYVTISWGGTPTPAPDFEPPSPPTPAPPPVPAPAPVPAPPPAPVAPGTELGRATRAYVRDLIEATAQGWETAANQLDAGVKVRDALTKGAEVQGTQRLSALRKNVSPILNRTLPEGAEPTSPQQRSAASALYRNLAAELRSQLP